MSVEVADLELAFPSRQLQGLRFVLMLCPMGNRIREGRNG